MYYNKLIIICIMSLILTACSSNINAQTDIATTEVATKTSETITITPTSGGTLDVAIRNPKTLNPLLNEDASIDEILKLVYDDLIILDENQKPAPSIASSWDISPDGKSITLKLRNDVFWHNGNNLTTNDVRFSIDTIRNSQETSAYKSCVSNIVSSSIIDDFTMVINYKQPFSAEVYNLNFPIISYDYYLGENILTSNKNMMPMGTGAYEFENLDEMKSLNLKRNPRWFKGSQSNITVLKDDTKDYDFKYIDNIKAIIVPKKEAELYMFDQRQIDFLSTDVVDWEKYSGTKETTINEYVTNYYDFLGVNFNSSIFNDKLVRQALAYAIPKEKIAKDIYLEHVTLTDTPINPKSWLKPSNELVYRYNINKSKELLEQAGWTDTDSNGVLDKNGMEFNFSLLVNRENPQRLEVANTIKETFKQIGIEVSVDIQDYQIYSENLKNKNFDTFLGGWKLSTVPDLNFAFHSSQIADGNNFISFNNIDMNSLLSQTYNAIGDNAMLESYKNLENYMLEELPYISLYFRNAAILMNESLKASDSYKENDNLPFKNNVYSQIDNYIVCDKKNKE